ncbi:MAG: hypothetical protein WA672_19650 [Candidatus Angelobacter sp.]
MRAFAEWKINQSTVLFEGRVLNIEIRHGISSPIPGSVLSVMPSLDTQSVTLQVKKAYKGFSKDVATVSTGMGTGDCGFGFEIGKSYLVDAAESSSGQLFTSICQATRGLNLAGPFLRILQNQAATPDDLLTPRAYWKKFALTGTGKICGTIMHRDSTAVTTSLTGSVWRVLNSPVAPAKYGDLHIEPSGSFCTDPLPAGRYIVGAKDGQPWDTGVEYQGYYPGTPHGSQNDLIEVKSEETVSNITLGLMRHPVYTVRGRVTAPHGNLGQVEDLRVILHSSDNELADPEDISIEADGTFEFNQIPPGHYSLSVIEYAGMNRKAKWTTPTLDIDVPKQVSGIVLTMTSAP